MTIKSLKVSSVSKKFQHFKDFFKFLMSCQDCDIVFLLGFSVFPLKFGSPVENI